MPSRDLVEILLQGSEIWNAWREKNRTVRLNFNGAELSKANLRGVNLKGADLSEAGLFEADLTKANLNGANLGMADLNGATLRNANLSCADLTVSFVKRADLRGVNLSSANLVSADIAVTNLQEANLSCADLSWTNLSGTNLREADLSLTDIKRADLTGANLDAANLTGASISDSDLTFVRCFNAQIGSTRINGVNLSSVYGLESVIHRRPSSIGIDTLELSRGLVPEIFLRGCGVPEGIITYMSSLVNNPIEFYSCFISYSHTDKAFARLLHDYLQGRGIRCWLDEHQLLPGHDIFEEVDRGIKLWDKVLLCASKDSLTSWWVDNEINRAFKKEQTLMRDRGKKPLALIPLNLDNYIFDSWENGKAEQVKSRLAADFTDWENDNKKLQAGLELVVKALRTDGGREEPPKSLL